LAGSWTITELLKQIGLVRDEPGSNGEVHFSAKALTADYKGLCKSLLTGPYKERALVPETPWLPPRKPGKVKVAWEGGRLAWEAAGSRFYAVSARVDGEWRLVEVTSDSSATLSTGDSEGADAYAVSAVSTTGACGEPTVVRVPGQD
jgi:hypothetical protein